MKITIVGGGSLTWTPTIVRDIVLMRSLADAEIVLHDINQKSLELTHALCKKIASDNGAPAHIMATDDRANALDSANYIIVTIATGGLDAMAHDLSIPEEYGIFHTVGASNGPAGWARAIREFDVFVGLAQAFNAHAPRAMVLNYTNPMTQLTDVLARQCAGPVVGLCHGLYENLEFIKDLYRLASEQDIAVQYAGINHFFWITRARAGEVDVLADLSERLKGQSLTELSGPAHADPLGFVSSREVATELFRLTGVMPYLGDRHICEWFARYVTSQSNMERYRICRTSVAQRRALQVQREKDVRRILQGELPVEYRKRSREAAADIIDAHSQGRVFIDVGNTPNVGQVCNLPLGAVVETAVRVDRNGFSPIAFGALPAAVVNLVEPWLRVLMMTVEACYRKDLRMALQALRLDPLCVNLTDQQVNEMGHRLLGAHRQHITSLAA